jgi:hypothetical protein
MPPLHSLTAYSEKYWRNHLQLSAYSSYIKIPYPKPPYCRLHIPLSYLLQSQRKPRRAQPVLQLFYWPAFSGIVFCLLAAATNYVQHLSNEIRFGVDIVCHSKGTEKPPEICVNLVCNCVTWCATDRSSPCSADGKNRWSRTANALHLYAANSKYYYYFCFVWFKLFEQSRVAVCLFSHNRTELQIPLSDTYRPV